jgi:hypothetical protein
MTLKRIALVVLVLSGLGLSAPAQAEWLDDFFLDARRNNCWPEPFDCPDRQAVRAPFLVMVHNGWIRQNLLDEHHFDGTGTSLNESGRLRVRWILTQAPRHHRTIYVHRTASPEVTAARVEAVEALASEMIPSDTPPQIVETDATAPGWPASQIYAIGQKFDGSAPEPRLPAVEASDSGSGQ